MHAQNNIKLFSPLSKLNNRNLFIFNVLNYFDEQCLQNKLTKVSAYTLADNVIRNAFVRMSTTPYQDGSFLFPFLSLSLWFPWWRIIKRLTRSIQYDIVSLISRLSRHDEIRLGMYCWRVRNGFEGRCSPRRPGCSTCAATFIS